MTRKHFTEYREHTATKHTILKDYLGAWVGILSTWNEKVAYIDGFCGPGSYQVGEEVYDGSPIIALRIAEYFADKVKVVCQFIDKKEEYCNDLEERIEELGFKPKYDIVCAEFEEALTHLLDRVPNMVPAFCFIDPFGYAGISLHLIKRFLERPTTETFITFMYDSISHWLPAPAQHSTMDALFGTGEWRHVLKKGLKKREKEIFLRDLYHKQLKTCAKHVWPFRMVDPEKAKTIYYLFHCTNHPKGTREMKKVMYKKGTMGTYTYMGKEHSQVSLFSTEPDVKELEDFLVEEFAGHNISFDEIVDSTLESPFIGKHYREALNNLKKAATIKKIPVTTKGQQGFNKKDVAVFPAKKPKKPKKKGFFY